MAPMARDQRSGSRIAPRGRRREGRRRRRDGGAAQRSERRAETFGIGEGELTVRRRYVLQIVPGDNTVIVGDREELLANHLRAVRVNWLLDEPPAAPLRCRAKIRYRHSAATATVTALPDDMAAVVFDEPQTAITPGQAVVIYEGARVLGGGWIESVD